ncbi:MAG TPA: ABC transporter substrate-binding protein [Thermoanaerobaculia bacterium]|nr:ABC transporter substrate-binding protein [Thermoanaerobaculia bacterium]
MSRALGQTLALGVVILVLATLLIPGAACRKPPPKRTLEVLVPILPATLDPFADSRLSARSLFTAIYEPLAEETAFGIRPAVAESWTNPNPETWVFRISRDALFHDGTPVTSLDVVEAAQASRTSRGSLASLADLKSIEILDDRTVQFRTHRPSEDFLLSISAVFIPRKTGGAFQGSGPFRVVTRTPDRVLLSRHRRPRRPAPLLDEVGFRRFSSPAEGLRLLRRSEVVAVLDPTPPMVEEVRGDPRYRVVVTESGGLTYLAVGLSADPGPLGDIRVRRALRLAIDLPELVKAGTVAGGTPSAQLIPPGAFGFDPKRIASRRDLPEARRLLSLAGFPDGFDADLDVNPNGHRAALDLARQVAEAGIRLRVALHTPDEFVARIDGRSSLYLYSWYVGQDAGQALRNAFHTKDVSRGLGSLNRTGFSSPAMDLAFADLAATARPEDRLRKLRGLSDLLDAELPWIPLFSAREARILPSWLDLPHRADGLFVIAEAREVDGRH